MTRFVTAEIWILMISMTLTFCCLDAMQPNRLFIILLWGFRKTYWRIFDKYPPSIAYRCNSLLFRVEKTAYILCIYVVSVNRLLLQKYPYFEVGTSHGHTLGDQTTNCAEILCIEP